MSSGPARRGSCTGNDKARNRGDSSDSHGEGSKGEHGESVGTGIIMTDDAIKSVTVTIADACPTCKNSNSIDLSSAAFKKIATLEQGMVGSKLSIHVDRNTF